jgi:hypothetical protein
MIEANRSFPHLTYDRRDVSEEMNVEEIDGPFIRVAKRMNTRIHDVEEIVLEPNTISEIKPTDLRDFCNLQYLFIARNQLTTLTNISYNIRLKLIDARHNQLRDIDLSGQFFLEELYLSDNRLEYLDLFLKKLSHLRDLSILDLRNNPLAIERNYRLTVIHSFERLKMLDGHVVKPEEAIRTRDKSSIGSKRAASSLLRSLHERPLSAADRIVQKKAESIRTRKERAKEEQRRIAQMRNQKADYDGVAQLRRLPMSEYFDVLGQLSRAKASTETRPQSEQSRRTRLFMKAPAIGKPVELNDGELLAKRLNPDLPPIFGIRVEHKILYPK